MLVKVFDIDAKPALDLELALDAVRGYQGRVTIGGTEE